MTDNEIIDLALTNYDNYQGNGFYEIYDYSLGKELKFSCAQDILKLMLHYGLIEETDNSFYKISRFGILVKSESGWVKRTKDRASKDISRNRKENFDLAHNFLTIILAFITLTLGYLNYNSFQKSKILENKNEKLTEQIELLLNSNESELNNITEEDSPIDTLKIE